MTESLAAVLTPPGQSALATIGLRGPLAWPAVRALFTPRGKDPLPDEPPAGRFWLGQLGDEMKDEAVLAVRPNGIELHVHGGREVSRYLLDLLAARGLRVCDWETFLDDERSALLARTPTLTTANLVLDAGNDLPTLRRRTSPARLVIAGAPNVGKSSLINALAGYQRSIVSPIPGTTRDVTTTLLAIDGWPVEVSDTAGVRGGADHLEAAGIDQARAAIAEADLCLWLVDASTDPVWPEAHRPNTRIVVNKCDLPWAWDAARLGDPRCISATTGQGMDDLLADLARWLRERP